MKRNRMGAAGAVMMVTAVVGGCATAPATSNAGATPSASGAPVAPSVPLPSGVTAAMVTAGRPLYDGPGDCSTCHGSDARGTMLGPNLTDRTWLNIDGSYDSIVSVITNGVAMPKEHTQPMLPKGGSNMTTEQVRALAAYIFSISRG
jgi:mono/diheme cytochrome c family protein